MTIQTRFKKLITRVKHDLINDYGNDQVYTYTRGDNLLAKYIIKNYALHLHLHDVNKKWFITCTLYRDGDYNNWIEKFIKKPLTMLQTDRVSSMFYPLTGGFHED